MKTVVTAARFSGTAESVRGLQLVGGRLRGVGRLVGDVTWSEGEGPVQVEVTLAGPRTESGSRGSPTQASSAT